jgi:hypothetical protein
LAFKYTKQFSKAFQSEPRLTDVADKSRGSGFEEVAELEDGEGEADEEEEEEEEEAAREGELVEIVEDSAGERKEGERNTGDAASIIVGPVVFEGSGVLNDMMVFRTLSKLCSTGEGG